MLNACGPVQLPAFKITLDDGSSYVTSMASWVTLAGASEYFMGQVQTSEDSQGKETRRIVVKVEAV